ncbi:DUF11 domain-containing protein [Leucobacter sp. OH1287]|nr:DUF11 domain-containing protein [Leucobacter sp. OH1287]
MSHKLPPKAVKRSLASVTATVLAATGLVAATTPAAQAVESVRAESGAFKTTNTTFPHVSVGDYVWWDVNRNGLQDAGEAPAAGVEVKITNNKNGTSKTTTTNAAGFYSFTDLEGGTSHTIQWKRPAGTTFTLPTVGGLHGTTHDIDSNADPVTGQVDFTTPGTGNNSATAPDNPTKDTGLLKLNLRLDKQLTSASTVKPGDTVTFDLIPSNDGPVNALPGWFITDVLPPELTLQSISGNNYGCSGHTCVSQVALPAGGTGDKVTVTATVNAGVSGEIKNVAYVGSADGETPETNPLGTPPLNTTNTDRTPTDNDDQVFLNAQKTLVSVGDYVWWDVNRNGLQDAGEAPVAGVEVKIYDSKDKLLNTTRTNDKGFFSFTDLAAGERHTIEWVKPAGTTFTTQMVDGLNGNTHDRDSNPDPQTGKVSFDTPTSGNNSATNPDNPTKDAGLLQLNLVLKKELTSDAVVKPGDTVTFKLTPSNDGPVNALAGWSVTDVLPQGLTLVEISGEGYNCTGATCVADAPLAAGSTGKPITVKATVDAAFEGVLKNVAYVEPKAGETPETNPLGEKPTTATDTDQTSTDNDAQAQVTSQKQRVSVGDYVWWDANRNGAQDAKETPVAGVAVKLYDASGALVKETVTNDKGFYSFTDLVSGDKYTIEFIAPEKSQFTTQNSGSDDAADSDADVATGKVTFTAPANGKNSATTPDDPTIDAGLLKFNLVLVKKLESAEVAKPGEIVTFTLTPSNEGPVDALAGWSVTDVLPEGLVISSISGEGYSCDNSTLTCVASQGLAAGATGNPVTVKATVQQNASGTIHNVAFVTPDPKDIPETNPLGDKPTSATNTDTTETDNDSQADVRLDKPIIPVIPQVPGLAQTGAELPMLLLAGAALLIITGGVLFVRRKA